MRLNRYAVLTAAALALPVTAAAQTYQAQTGTLDVRIKIEGACNVGDALLDFGSHSDLTTDKDTGTKFTVECPKETKYWVGLDQGGFWEAGANIRRMEKSGDYIKYRLYSDSTYTTEWHDTIGSNTIGVFTSPGGPDTYPVYGRVRTADQTTTTPGLGTYTDQVLIKVAY